MESLILDISTPTYPEKYTAISPEDYERVSQYRWRYNKDGYAVRDYKRQGKKITERLHRFLMNPKPEEHIDHINHDRLDNRRSNLRICTNQQNQQNTQPNKGRMFKGVFQNSQGKGWEAAITHNKERFYLGIYQDPFHAALAYDIFARVLFKGFSHTNLDGVPPLKELIKQLAVNMEFPEIERLEEMQKSVKQKIG